MNSLRGMEAVLAMESVFDLSSLNCKSSEESERERERERERARERERERDDDSFEINFSENPFMTDLFCFRN